MLLLNENVETPELKSAAESICLVAHTAPKRKGKFMKFIALVTDDDKCRLQDRMRLIGERDNVQSFLRDAGNLDHAPVVVLIGTRKEPLRLPACGYCGFDDCNAMQSPFRRKVRTLSSTGHKIWLPLSSCELAPFRLCL